MHLQDAVRDEVEIVKATSYIQRDFPGTRKLRGTIKKNPEYGFNRGMHSSLDLAQNVQGRPRNDT